MLPNAKVITFTDSEFLGENQQGGEEALKLPPPPLPRLGYMKSQQ